MNERKYTDEEVIKALECCSKESMIDCRNCPYEADCNMGGSKMQADALDLINRQKAEIERLKADIDDVCVFFEEHIKISKQEHEKQMEMLNQIQKQISLSIARARNEAIKEFAERLKEAYPQGDRNNKCPALYYDDYCYIIDDLVEEMTEGENG